MEIPMIWLLGILFLILLFNYSFQWIQVVFFLRDASHTNHSSPQKNIDGVSILIPFRNEELRIAQLLHSIETSHKTDIPVEFIFIDDHSTDFTVNKIQELAKQSSWDIQISALPISLFGKKEALNWGMNNSKYSVIHTIDADCLFSPNFLNDTHTAYIQSNKNLLILPVKFTGSMNLLEQYQIIENTALVALGLFHLNQQKPSMANGANLMFDKSKFIQLNPYQSNKNILGGDDIFTLEAFYKDNLHQIGFSTLPQMAISTPVLKSFSELTQQRLRWFSKTKQQQFKYTAKSQLSLVIFLLSIWVILAFTAYSGHAHYFIFALASKIMVDLFTQFQISKNFNTKIKFTYIFISSVIQIFYIPSLGILSLFKKPNWKNRQA